MYKLSGILAILFTALIFFNCKSDVEAKKEIDCLGTLPFEIISIDSFSLAVSSCSEKMQSDLQAFLKKDNVYQEYNFLLKEFQNTSLVPVSVENAFNKNTGVCLKNSLKPGAVQSRFWKKMESDSIYFIATYSPI